MLIFYGLNFCSIKIFFTENANGKVVVKGKFFMYATKTTTFDRIKKFNNYGKSTDIFHVLDILFSYQIVSFYYYFISISFINMYIFPYIS